MLAVVINLGSFGLVYAAAVGAAWLVGPLLGLHPGLSFIFGWFLFQLHLVVGLLVTGDLPGIPRATRKLAGLMAGVSLLLGLVDAVARGSGRLAGLAGPAGLAAVVGNTAVAWAAAGILPWVLALLAEALAGVLARSAKRAD